MKRRLKDDLKSGVKRVRSWPALNIPATTGLRSVLARTGRAAPDSLVRYLPRAGVVEAPLPDGQTLRLWSKADDDIANAVFWRGWSGHEPETSPHFYELARSARVTLDVGAHVGYFSLLAAFANPAGQVHAFEPLPAVRERLERNVALNGLQNVSVHSAALADRRGRAEFFHVPDSIPSSSSLSRSFMESIVDKDRLAVADVEVVTTDEFLAERGVTGIDLVKIDTEATEDAVLRGMVETLRRDGPAVVCEVLEDGPAEGIEAVLRPLGYRFSLLTPDGRRRCERVTPHPTWRNFLFERS